MYFVFQIFINIKVDGPLVALRVDLFLELAVVRNEQI